MPGDRATQFPWDEMRQLYITSNVSQRELAEKYGCSETMVANVSSDQQWVELRKQHSANIEKLALEQITKEQVAEKVSIHQECQETATLYLRKVKDKISALKEKDTTKNYADMGRALDSAIKNCQLVGLEENETNIRVFIEAINGKVADVWDGEE